MKKNLNIHSNKLTRNNLKIKPPTPMKTLSTSLVLLFISIMSFGQNLSFSPASGTQVIPIEGGSFGLQITRTQSGGITIFDHNIGISTSSNTSGSPTVTVAANSGPGRTLSFKVYFNGFTYVYTISQVGINCISLTGSNPISITGNLNPCLNQTITYSLPILTSSGITYEIEFMNNNVTTKFTTIGDFNITHTVLGQMGLGVTRITNCFRSSQVIFWGNVDNPSIPSISGMNSFTTNEPIDFTSTLDNGETNIWKFNSNTSTGTAFTTTLGIGGSYSVSVQNIAGRCSSRVVSKSFTVKSNQTISGISALQGSFTYPVAAISLANATATSGLPVSIASSNPALISVSGNVLYFLKTGSATITLSQAGNSQYFAAPSLAYSVSIAKGIAVISVTSAIPSVITVSGSGTSITLSGVSSSGIPLQYSLSGGGSVLGNIITFTQTGTVTLTASNLASDNYEASSQTFVINVVGNNATNVLDTEKESTIGIALYPNPSKGTFTFVNKNQAIEYFITDSEGKIVYKNIALSGVNTIETKLPKGIYFLILDRKKQKFVVE